MSPKKRTEDRPSTGELVWLEIELDHETELPLTETLRFMQTLNRYYAAKLQNLAEVDRRNPFFWYRVTAELGWEEQLFLYRFSRQSPWEIVAVVLAIPPAIEACTHLIRMLESTRVHSRPETDPPWVNDLDAWARRQLRNSPIRVRRATFHQRSGTLPANPRKPR